jgi:2,4-dienoyl-CoA reductase-like NADH-dependent reductase (Old Yellow Enzyme family)
LSVYQEWFMAQLFSPVSLSPGLTLKNRIVIAPMCQYSAQQGEAGDWHLIHLGQLALSGAGLLIIEASAVEPEGRITAADVGLWSDATEAALERVIRAVRQHSSMPLGIQLAHAGRKASSAVPWVGGPAISVEQGGWRCVAPSAIAFSPQDAAPQPLDEAGLQRIKQAFVDAAVRARRIGFELIELHMAHGYLLHQFLSPLSNQRSDNYGGSLENRMRFPLEVLDAVQAAVPELAISVRISATDWIEGGWDLEQSVLFGKQLSQRKIACIHVSSGGLAPAQKISLAPGYQVPLAERIRQETGLLTIAVGLITEAEHAEQLIASGQADMVALARGVLYDPRWPWHAAAELGAQVEAPPQYWRCQPHGMSGLFGDHARG